MRLILFLLVSLAAGYGLIRVASLTNGGYVKVFVSGYLIEINLLVFALVLIVTVLLLYLVIRLVINLLRAPKKVGDWSERRNEKQSQVKLGDGFLSLMKGDWKRAEKQLMAKAQHSKIPFVNYLAAAQAAQEQGKYQQRDFYLSQASQEAPEDKLAISMTKARLHQQVGQAEGALATLRDVEDQGQRNPQFMAMLAQAYDEVDDFEKLQEILPKARRLGALPEDVINDMQIDIDLDTFNVAKDKDLAWKSLAKTSKQSPEFVKIYADYQIGNNRSDIAEKIIRTTLKNHWSDELVNTYGRINSTQRKKLLRQVEGWLLARPENAELHLALGRLAKLNQNTEQAEEAFEMAIKLGDLPEAYEELGRLYESEQDLRKALTLYRTGLSSSNTKPLPKAIEAPASSEIVVADTELESDKAEEASSDKAAG
ncbi:MAG: heme biosynthesis HemY N-terminal domain-containing protein [Arenicella sp.]